MSLRATHIPPETFAALPAELQEQVPVYHETQQPKIRATMGVCLFISYIALGLRLYARRFTKQPFGLDDLFTGLAVFFTTISVGLLAHLTNLGYGRHEIVIVVEHINDFDALNKTIVASIAVYLPVIFCVKASALFLYRRVFPNRILHIICHVVLGFTAAYALTAIFWLTISCLPPLPPTAEEPVAQLKCPNMHLGIALLLILITNVLLDAIILCLPLPLIWRLHTSLRNKLQLTLVFTLGSFVFIVSILRVVSVFSLNPMDDNWDSAYVQIWSIAESSVSVVAISLPVIRPLLRQAIYREDGSSRLPLISKSRRSDQDQNKGGRRSIALLTFGRGGVKGPSGRKPRGLDVTTIGTVTTTEATGFEGSVARLMPEDADLGEGRQQAHIQP
ncbi:hypothetical protein PG989_004870 [Apiospora arundinis]